MRKKGQIYANSFLFLLTAAFLFPACNKNLKEGIIIITEGLSGSEIPDYISGASWRYICKTRLIAVDPKDPDKSPVILTSGFFSACFPEVSYDGMHILFAAQKGQDDPWQIWEMKIRNRKVRQITGSSDNSTDPAYLPDGRIVFSRSIRNDSLMAGHVLFTCNPDGSEQLRITYNPHTYFSSSVLKDGRILAISRQVFPDIGDPLLTVLRPDGTKAELFYKGGNHTEISSRCRETDYGRIFFIESKNEGSANGRVISINYNRPLHSRVELTEPITGDFNSVFPVKSGNLIVSFRKSNSEPFSLYEFNAGDKTMGNQIFRSPEGNILDAVAVEVREIPKKLPSEVDPGVKTGLLLCQNINVTGMNSPSGKNLPSIADRIEVLGIDSSLGIVNVEKDGSFYLKVVANMPFRIRTLNADGEVINGPGSWYYLRPNERRGCAGCHEDNEIVPANRYSLAVSKQPVSVPVHIEKIIEKEVELE